MCIERTYGKYAPENPRILNVFLLSYLTRLETKKFAENLTRVQRGLNK